MNLLASAFIIAALIVAGCSSSSDNTSDVIIDDMTLPTIDASPVGLKGVAYTDTETEIFWQKAITDIEIVGYDIVRNSELVSSKLDAKSYYDNTVIPGASYEYKVIAVGAMGGRSEAAVINIDTPPAYKAINTDNYLQITEFLFSVINGEFTDSSRKLVEKLYSDGPTPNENDLATLLSLVGTGYDEEASQVYMDYNCQQGGTYRSMATGAAVGGGSGKFDQCQLNSQIANGSYSVNETLVKYVYNPGWTQNIIYDLQLSDSTGALVTTLDGASTEDRGTYRNAWSWNVSQYESPSFIGMTRVTDFFTQAVAGAERLPSGEEAPFVRTVESRFVAQSATTGNKALTVSTNELLSTTETIGGYRTGVLLVAGGDGSSMTIEFNTGDAKTFKVTVNSDGTTFSHTLLVANHPLLCVQSGADAVRPHPDNRFVCAL